MSSPPCLPYPKSEGRAAGYRVHRVPNLGEFFHGVWGVKKLGWDGVTGQRLRFHGEATFSTCAEGLLFQERGTIGFGAYQGEASQDYIFAVQDSHTAEVRFADERPFHTLNLETGKAHVWHDCAPDRYMGRYRVFDSNGWVLSWRVAGPRKRQILTSRFIRARGQG